MEPLTFAVRNGGSFRPDTSALPSSSDAITHLDTQSFGRPNLPAVDAVDFDNFNASSWSSYQRGAYSTLHVLPTELPFSAQHYAPSPHGLQDASFASSQPPVYLNPMHFAQGPSSTLDTALFQDDPPFDDIFELDDPLQPTEQDLEQTGVIQAEYNKNLSSVSRNRISEEKWARHKSIIKKLYLEEGHTLSQTCKLLQEDHGFEVQVRQLKGKISDWKWIKNLDREKAQYMAHKTHQRKQELNKASEFHCGGQIWKWDRIETYLKRSKTETARDWQGAAPPTPQGVRCITPALSSSQVSPLLNYTTHSMNPPRLPTPHNAPSMSHHERQIPSLRQALGAIFTAQSAGLLNFNMARNGSMHHSLEALDDPVSYARECVTRGDYSIEPPLWTFIERHMLSTKQIQALSGASVLFDLHVARKDHVPADETILQTVNMVRKLFQSKSCAQPEVYRAGFAFLARLILHEHWPDPAEILSETSRAAEKTFMLDADKLLSYLISHAKLLEKTGWRMARPFYERALALVLDMHVYSGPKHDHCDVERLLVERLKRGQGTGWSSSWTRVSECSLTGKVRQLLSDNAMTVRMLDDL